MTLTADTAPVTAADNAPLTAEQHSALLVEKTAPPKKAQARAQAEDAQAEITEETVDSPEGAGETVEEEDTEAATQADEGAEGEPTEANAEGDESDQAEPAPPAIEPPKFWDAEGKESFAKLAPEAQKAVLKYEEQRTKAVAKAMEQSAETRKSYEAKQKQLLETAARIEEQYIDPATARMEEWDTYFASTEADELAQTNPAEYLRLQNAHRREKAELDKARAAKADAETAAFREFVAEQAKLIPELIPEFADETDGPKRRGELFTYLQGEGFDAERLRGLTAKEAQIAWKARKFDSVKDFDALVRDAEAYRKSMKLAAKAPAPKPKPQAGPTAPATGQGQRLSSSEAAIKRLEAKKNWSQQDHTDYQLLKAKLRK